MASRSNVSTTPMTTPPSASSTRSNVLPPSSCPAWRGAVPRSDTMTDAIEAVADMPAEERLGALDEERYAALLARLSHQSVVKHYDAFADIPWDAPEMRVDPDDPRWILSSDDPLGRTAWYQAQPETVRSRIGLHMLCTFMQIGIEFESVLQRGLLDFAQQL